MVRRPSNHLQKPHLRHTYNDVRSEAVVPAPSRNVEEKVNNNVVLLKVFGIKEIKETSGSGKMSASVWYQS